MISCNSSGYEDDKNDQIKIDDPDYSTKAELGYDGYYGYLGYSSTPVPEYGLGVSFYTAAWELVEDPLEFFQIGLPGTWIVPDNSDNLSTPLCPTGTLAREWSAWGPTWNGVFQTLEGGLGFWDSDVYRHNSPKFNINATPQCYDYGTESPGWGWGRLADGALTALPDNLLSIAQLSNRLLIPPDGLTFSGNPDGEFMGYAYMALPLTDSYNNSIVSIGNQSWTGFVNTENFKGPIAYYLPETWAKLSESYPAIEGRGLDNRKGVINGGAMEINRTTHFEALGPDRTLYIKVPKLNFPIKENKEALLVQDLIFYNELAIFNRVLDWRINNVETEEEFSESGMLSPSISPNQILLNVKGEDTCCFENIIESFVDNGGYGFRWLESDFEVGSFPEYYKYENNKMVPILESEVPSETELVEATFPNRVNGGAFTSPNTGSWVEPGPEQGPFTTTLNDGSTVTFYWYKFIDQPVFQQYNWDNEKKEAFQNFIEKIHQKWDLTQNYIPPPTVGNLVSIDENLIVTPPSGYEYGYVPIVVRQDS